MAEDTFRLKILSPLGIVLQCEVISALAQAIDGEVGILAGHTEYLGLLGEGELRYQGPEQSGSVTVSGGSLHFHAGVLTVLADRVEG